MAHIGIAVNDVKADAEWYIKMLGCETMGIFFTPNGEEMEWFMNCFSQLYQCLRCWRER